MYHLSVKPLSRASGRSATAAAAYRSASEVVDQRTGEIHDYRKKRGVEHTEIITPPGAPSWADDRARLWNAAEAAEKRKDARIAREYEIAIPKELSPAQGIELVRDFAYGLSERYQVPVDIAIHHDHARHWDGTEKGFEGYHAHLLTTTRRLGKDGLGDKTPIELSDTKRKDLGLDSGASELEKIRESWEIVANRHLEQAGHQQRIDRRTLKAQGIEREPTQHLGPQATAMERRGEKTDIGDINRRIEAAYLQGLQDKQTQQALNQTLIDTQTSLQQALKAREQANAQAVQDKLKAGSETFLAKFQLFEKERLAKLAQQERDRQEKEQQAAILERARQAAALSRRPPPGELRGNRQERDQDNDPGGKNHGNKHGPSR